MLRLIVLLTAVVCGNACRLESVNPTDSTDSPGCTDSNGNHQELYSEWGNEAEICVCVDYGVICCDRSFFITAESIADSTTTASTDKIYYDNFGAFTENDQGEPEEEPSISDEDPSEPDSSDSPEVIADPPEVVSDSPEVIVVDPPEVVSDSPEVIVVDPPEVVSDSPEVIVDPPEVVSDSPEVVYDST